MKPDLVLNRGRAASLQGQHAAALRDFKWFHQNALKHDRAFYGVRLSFALGYWKNLADVYPAARRELQALKRRGETKLRHGRGNRDLFADVRAINRELGCERDTYSLFREIERRQPALAKRCADLAIAVIVEAKDYSRAAKYLPHPIDYLLWLSDRLNADLKRNHGRRDLVKARRKAYVEIYCDDVHVALRVLRGLRNHSAFKAAFDWAIALVEPRHASAMVCTKLASLRA